MYGSGSVSHAVELKEKTHTPLTVLGGSGTPNKNQISQIRIRDLQFTYPGSGVSVFRGLDLEIQGGKSLAIVGRNGAGKTTLVKLLTRLYDPTDGQIEIDGTNLRTIDPVLWRSHVAVIFQDFVRYELSTRDNIGFGSLQNLDNDSMMNAAAHRAGSAELIDTLPYAWKTVLSRGYEKGVDLSGGQWQRIALARAFAAVEGGAELFVLDEPTANLDVRAEAALFERFLDLTRGLTTLLISHRMSSVRHADEICVIDKGVVAERGSHEELLRIDGLYSHMFHLQARHFSRESDE